MKFKYWIETNDQAELMNWFKGSVLVNNGQPMVLYHGTNANPFKQFQFQKGYRGVLFTRFEVMSHGIFLSESYNEAKTYGKNVVACYARMINPLVDPRRDKHLGVDRLPLKKEMDILKIIGPMVQKEPYWQSDSGNRIPSDIASLPNADKQGFKKVFSHFVDIGVQRYYINPKKDDFAHQWIYNAIGTDGIDWDVLDNPSVVSRMRSLGYDGTFVQENEGEIGRSVFLVSPDQVRIIDWNNQSRDPNYESEGWDDES